MYDVLDVCLGTSSRNVLEDSGMKLIANKLRSYTPADIVGICRDAAQKSLSQSRTLSVSDIEMEVTRRIPSAQRNVGHLLKPAGTSTSHINAGELTNDSCNLMVNSMVFGALSISTRTDIFNYCVAPFNSHGHVSLVLLYGPPGTGKTSIASAISELARVPSLILTPADVMDKTLGSAEHTLFRMFSIVKNLTQCVLVLDEVDAWGDGGGGRVYNVLISELRQLNCTRRDGYSTVVIATTNRPDYLERIKLERMFDHYIILSSPDSQGRRVLWQKLLIERDMPCDDEIYEDGTLERLVTISDGVTGMCRHHHHHDVQLLIYEVRYVRLHFQLSVDVMIMPIVSWWWMIWCKLCIQPRDDGGGGYDYFFQFFNR